MVWHSSSEFSNKTQMQQEYRVANLLNYQFTHRRTHAPLSLVFCPFVSDEGFKARQSTAVGLLPLLGPLVLLSTKSRSRCTSGCNNLLPSPLICTLLTGVLSVRELAFNSALDEMQLLAKTSRQEMLQTEQ